MEPQEGQQNPNENPNERPDSSTSGKGDFPDEKKQTSGADKCNKLEQNKICKCGRDEHNTANRIGWWQLGVNAALMIFTGSLFLISVSQYHNSIDAVKETAKANNIAMDVFKNVRRSVLAFGGQMRVMRVNDSLKIGYHILNITQEPVLIYSFKEGVFFDTVQFGKDPYRIVGWNQRPVSIYRVKDIAFAPEWVNIKPTPTEMINFEKGNSMMFIEVKYLNPITMIKYKYDLVFKIPVVDSHPAIEPYSSGNLPDSVIAKKEQSN